MAERTDDQRQQHAKYMREYYASHEERRRKHYASVKRWRAQTREARHANRMATIVAKARELVRSMVPTEAAYLAGLLDSDGGIYAQLKRDKHNNRVSPYAAFYVTNTNRRMLEWCQNVTGIGSILTQTSSRPSHWGKRPIHRWDIGSRAGVFVMEQVRPFLVCKGEQADLYLELAALKLQSTKNHVVDLERQFAIVEAIQALNKANGHTGTRVLLSDDVAEG